MSLYYEAHITIEPVFDDRLEEFKQFANTQQFRVADLLMQKRSEDTPERSKFDTFCTGRDTNLILLKVRMSILLHWLQNHGFKVWRYKIEDTLIDSRFGEDVLHAFDGQVSIQLDGVA